MCGNGHSLWKIDGGGVALMRLPDSSQYTGPVIVLARMLLK
jgi:hypothetical protein